MVTTELTRRERLAVLIEAVVSGPCFQSDELPPVPPEMRKPPAARPTGADLFDRLEVDGERT